jgi:hypothetical protein
LGKAKEEVEKVFTSEAIPISEYKPHPKHSVKFDWMGLLKAIPVNTFRKINKHEITTRVAVKRMESLKEIKEGEFVVRSQKREDGSKEVLVFHYKK